MYSPLMGLKFLTPIGTICKLIRALPHENMQTKVYWYLDSLKDEPQINLLRFIKNTSSFQLHNEPSFAERFFEAPTSQQK